MVPTTWSGARTFGASANLLLAVGALSAFVGAISLDAALRHGDWKDGLAILAAALLAFAAALALRLDISPDGVRQRFLIGSRAVAFDRIAHARLEVIGRRGRGRFTLSLVPREDRHIRIGLRKFPVEASVALLSELEARGIEIEIADDRARYYAEQVIAARIRLQAEVALATSPPASRDSAA